MKYSTIFWLLSFLFSSLALACGNNPNAIIQGPFEDDSFENGQVCFQLTQDGKDIDFYLSYTVKGIIHNKLVDTWYYSDAPVELMSVFFTPVNGVKNIVVLLRWSVNYEVDNIRYPYYYEVRSYKKEKNNSYVLNLSSDDDIELSGYEVIRGKVLEPYRLNDAKKIKKYFINKYNG